MDRTRTTPFVQLTVKSEIREDGGLRVFSSVEVRPLVELQEALRSTRRVIQ